MRINIEVDDKRWRAKLKNYKAVIKDCCGVIGFEGEVTFLLSGDKNVRRLNKDFRKIDKSTNVLSFPMNDDYLGDVIFAFETIKKEAEEQGKSFKNHFSHLVIHSILHLLGYDHIKPNERKKMEKLEIELLQKLGIPNPYN